MFNARQHLRASVYRLCCTNLAGTHPDCAQYALIQLLCRSVLVRMADESEAQIGEVFARVMPVIYAEQIFGREVVSGFFTGFANGRLDQCFTFFQMPCRLIEPDTVSRFFFNQQKPAILFDDGGYGGVGFPDHVGYRAAKRPFYPAGPELGQSRGTTPVARAR